MKVEKHCGYCKHCFLGSHNNYWCERGRGTVREPWGFVWKVDANKCNDFEVKVIYKNIEFE